MIELRNKLVSICDELDRVRKYPSIGFDSYIYGLLTSSYDSLSRSICFINTFIDDDEQKVY